MFTDILATLRTKLLDFWTLRRRDRVRFDLETGVSTLSLPAFAARLYKETKLLGEAIGNRRFRRSCEVGCGHGRLTGWVMDYSDKHHAVEPSTELRKAAMELYPSVKFYDVVAQALPFEDGFFDLVVSWTVLQHIQPLDVGRAISEIKRVTSPDGVIIIAENTAGTETKRCWSRSVEQYQEYFRPFTLTWIKPRIIERTWKKDAGHVMRFEMR